MSYMGHCTHAHTHTHTHTHKIKKDFMGRNNYASLLSDLSAYVQVQKRHHN